MQDETVSRALYDAMRMALKDIEAVLARHGCPSGATMTDWVDEQLTALAAATKPVDMLLLCPNCGVQHIDAVETGTALSRSGLDTLTEAEVVTWSNPPHRSHLCHHCGTIWRPADVATNGVAAIETRGKNDSTLFATKAAAQATPQSKQTVWRCFHCDETFTDAESAALHFGKSVMQSPACLIDIAEYRAMEQRMRSYNEEDTALHREIHGLQAQHQVALKREEEKGYARGLADGMKEATRSAQPTEPNGDKFQSRVQPWMMACFGPEIAADTQERNHRFLEEALELVQACGATASEAHQLVDYVYGRPVGDKHQEIGGVMVTLAALCLAQGHNMHAAGETELARIWTKVEQIRAKQAAKPNHSPLPEQHTGQPLGVAEGVREVIPLSDFSVELRFHSCRQAQKFIRAAVAQKEGHQSCK